MKSLSAYEYPYTYFQVPTCPEQELEKKLNMKKTGKTYLAHAFMSNALCFERVSGLEMLTY